MEFSSVAFCAENKRKISFQTFPLLSSGTLIHQSSSMGIHKSDNIPFVELTGHKLGEPLHSSFEMTELNLTKRFGLTGKIHHFTNNTKNDFMRGESFLPRKEMYSQQFPAIAFSQLVGGFVGSKSQLGSSGRESCQIWDIIFDKLAEFCGVPQSTCCSLFDTKHESCYNLGKNLSQEILGSFCQKSVDGSHIIIENTNKLLHEKVNDTLSHPNAPSHNNISLSVKPTPVISSCLSNGNKFCPASDVSKQSYAEVAKTFASAKNKEQYTRTSTMQRKRNSPHCGGMLRNNSRQFDCSIDNWRYSQNPFIKDYKNQHKLPPSYKKKPNYSKHKKAISLERKDKIERNNRDINISESDFERVDSRRNFVNKKRQSVQSVSNESVKLNCHKKVYMGCSQVAYDRSVDKNSNCIRSSEDKSVKSCIALKCSSSSDGELDGCTVFSDEVEGGSMSLVIHTAGNIQSSPSNPACHQNSKESSARRRYLSECSTDSDDSFVIFEPGVDCDAVIAIALVRAPSVSDSDLSEDGVINQSSDDDDDDEESDDTETVIGLEEVNARWQRDYSQYSGCEKNPVKVQFACDNSLETVHPIITWNYAYRAARCGPWEQMARDRERFMARIRQMEPVLAPVFSAEHRHHVLKRRKAEESSKIHSQVT